MNTKEKTEYRELKRLTAKTDISVDLVPGTSNVVITGGGDTIHKQLANNCGITAIEIVKARILCGVKR